MALLQELPLDQDTNSRAHRDLLKKQLEGYGLALHDDLTDMRQGVVVKQTSSHDSSTDDKMVLLDAKSHQTINSSVFSKISMDQKQKGLATKTLDKMAAVFDSKSKTVYVSVHGAFGLDQKILCELIRLKGKAIAQHFSGAKTVIFGGDYNIDRSASLLAKECGGKDISIGTTVDEKSYSSRTNLQVDPKGTENPYNIDLLITYTPQ